MRGACSLQIIKKIILLVQWRVWNFLKRFTFKIGKSIDKVKCGLLSKYITDQFKHLSIKMKVI